MSSDLRVNWIGLHVEEGEEVGQSTHAIDTVAEHDCSTLNERYVRESLFYLWDISKFLGVCIGTLYVFKPIM